MIYQSDLVKVVTQNTPICKYNYDMSKLQNHQFENTRGLLPRAYCVSALSPRIGLIVTYVPTSLAILVTSKYLENLLVTSIKMLNSSYVKVSNPGASSWRID